MMEIADRLLLNGSPLHIEAAKEIYRLQAELAKAYSIINDLYRSRPELASTSVTSNTTS